MQRLFLLQIYIWPNATINGCFGLSRRASWLPLHLEHDPVHGALAPAVALAGEDAGKVGLAQDARVALAEDGCEIQSQRKLCKNELCSKILQNFLE